MQPTSGLHHAHLRKRIHKKYEKYPHPDKLKRIFDKLVIIVAFATMALTIPQILKIFYEQNAAGVSLIAWTTYSIAAVFWLFYGVLHKAKPIIITYIGYLIVNLLIVAGVIIYG